MDDDPRQMVSIRLRSSSLAAVDALAAEMDVSRSVVLRMALRAGVAQMQRDKARVIQRHTA